MSVCVGGDQRLKTLIIHFGLGQSGCSSGHVTAAPPKKSQDLLDSRWAETMSRTRVSETAAVVLQVSHALPVPPLPPLLSWDFLPLGATAPLHQNSCRICSSENAGEELLPDRGEHH